MRGSPKLSGVAPASTNSHRGVITAIPKELSLGFTRCTTMQNSKLIPRRHGVLTGGTREGTHGAVYVGVEGQLNREDTETILSVRCSFRRSRRGPGPSGFETL